MESTSSSAAESQSAVRKRLRAQVLQQVVRGTIRAPYCAICCGPIVRLAMTGSCLHQFCFRCIYTRSRSQPTPCCPLCKSAYTSLLYNIVNHLEYGEMCLVPGTPHNR